MPQTTVTRTQFTKKLTYPADTNTAENFTLQGCYISVQLFCNVVQRGTVVMLLYEIQPILIPYEFSER